jgi:hypothetical protein
VSTPAIVEALRTFTTEILRSEEFRTALRDVVSEMLTARPEAVEMVPIATFAREHSLHEATVRQMAKEGRVEATKIGKRQWRVNRASPIQPLRAEERKVSGRELAIERARLLARSLREVADDDRAGKRSAPRSAAPASWTPRPTTAASSRRTCRRCGGHTSARSALRWAQWRRHGRDARRVSVLRGRCTVIAQRWTMRVAHALCVEFVELVNQERREAYERLCAQLDGGLGQLAVSAVAALPPGPARDFEIARWARRAVDNEAELAFLITGDMSDAEIAAMAENTVRVRLELAGRSS